MRLTLHPAGIALALCAACVSDPPTAPVTSPAAPPVTQSPTPTGAPASGQLRVPPVFQETPVWCWAASAEMVFRYYGLPNLNRAGDYQCGIVAVVFGPQSVCWYDCTRCLTGSGTVSNLQTVINEYGVAANQLGVPSRVLTSTLVFGPLRRDVLAAEISAGRPVVAGISPSGFALPNLSEHFAVIAGFDFTGGRTDVLVDDPFPYNLPEFSGRPNPYLAAGGQAVGPASYVIPYARLTAALNWGNTIYRIQPR